MNRNVESHFSKLPAVNVQRSILDRGSSYSTTFNAGQLIPFYVDEVLPGDTFDVSTSKVVRMQTLLTPLMDNLYLDTYFFFVPNRLVWDKWKEFCGENTESAWAPTSTHYIPKIAAPPGGFETGSIADYMGLPVGVEWKSTDLLAPSALPFRAYALICDHFFRDENLTDPLLIPKDSANQQGVKVTPRGTSPSPTGYISDTANGGDPFRVARYHDYFSSALPAPQKGSPVSIPVDLDLSAPDYSPVVTRPVSVDLSKLTAAPVHLPYNGRANLAGIDGWPLYPAPTSNERIVLAKGSHVDGNGVNQNFAGMHYYSNYGFDPSSSTSTEVTGSVTANQALVPINLWSDNSGFNLHASGVSFTINQFRLAYVYQCYLETLARSGTRYSELLLGLFGVRSPDARLQDPEYLGGNRIPINVSEVTNTAQAEKDFLGDVGAKSVTSDSHHDFIKSFTEHGYVIGVCCVRYDHSYCQGMPRFWTRREFTDFYNPKFANLGEVPIYKAELYATKENMNAEDTGKLPVFGYQEIWADYRYRPNMVTGFMRPNVPNSISYWTLADKYDSEPTLSDGWIRESASVVDRALAVTSAVADQFWADFYVSNRSTRPMPMYSVPGLEPHF